MKSLKFHINIAATDCYLYGGHIFIVLNNGDLLSASLTKIVKKFIEYSKPHFSLLRLAFLRNNFIDNQQGKYFTDIPNLKKVFINEWKKLSKINDIVIELDRRDFAKIAAIPELPVYDIRAYAMRLYVSTKKGLYEILLNPQNDYIIEPSGIEKVFDQKIIDISAKSGKLFISGGNEGLFHGGFYSTDDKLKIVEKSIKNKSLKTSWSGYDLLNYENQNYFDYLINEVIDNTNKYKYSKFDEKPERKTFGNIGVETLSMGQLLINSKIMIDDVKYCFNSNNQGFFYLYDNSFYAISLLKSANSYLQDQDKKSIRFSSKKRLMPKANSNNSRPLSSQIVPNGCVVEYMNNVALIQNNEVSIIEKESVYSVRSYMNSIRYKNLVTIVKDTCITIHSLYPFKDNARLLDIDSTQSNIWRTSDGFDFD